MTRQDEFKNVLLNRKMETLQDTIKTSEYVKTVE